MTSASRSRRLEVRAPRFAREGHVVARRQHGQLRKDPSNAHRRQLFIKYQARELVVAFGPHPKLRGLFTPFTCCGVAGARLCVPRCSVGGRCHIAEVCKSRTRLLADALRSAYRTRTVRHLLLPLLP